MDEYTVERYIYFVLGLLGIAAGLITTLTGFGGGFVLLLAMAVVWDPLTALVVSSLALLVGNAHRLLVYRRELKRAIAVPFLLGALPGSMVGALVTASMSSAVLHVVILVMTLFAVLRVLVGWEVALSPRSLLPSGAGIGLVTAGAGGAGFLAGPLFLSAGLSGNPYIATMSAAAIALHIGRLGGYLAGGLVDARIVGSAALIAISIVLGNWLGIRIRAHLGPRSMRALEYGALVLCVGLAVLGVTR